MLWAVHGTDSLASQTRKCHLAWGTAGFELTITKPCSDGVLTASLLYLGQAHDLQ